MHGILSFLGGVLSYYAFAYFPLLTVSIGVLLSSFFLIRKKPFLLLIGFCAVGFALLSTRAPDEEPFSGDAEIRCVVQTYPELKDDGMFRQVVQVISATSPSSGERLLPVDDREMILLSEVPLTINREYDLAVQVFTTENHRNPGSQPISYLYARLSAVRGERPMRFSLLSLVRTWRQSIHAYISEHVERDPAALIASVTIGSRAGLSEKVKESFRATGLAHLLSISGTHFGLLSLIVFGLFRMIVGALPLRVLNELTIYATPAQAASLLTLPCMVAYLGISGGSIPAVRSFIMVGIFLVGLLIGRKGFWLSSVLVAALIIVLSDPQSLFSLSFQLSFVAVVFIGFSLEATERGKETKPVGIRSIRNAIVISLAASVGTAPLVAYHFHALSLISPVSNLLIAPFIGFILIPLSVVSAFVFLLTGYYPLLPLIAWTADTAIKMIDMLSHVPYAQVSVPAFPPILLFLFYGGCVIVALFRERRSFLLLPLLPFIAYGIYGCVASERLSVTFLDVGQGDAAVVELPDKKTIVIDTGKTGREVASFLRYIGKEGIDALVLSHGHPDHAGGLSYLSERFSIHEIWHGARTVFPGVPDAAAHRILERGDLIEGEGYRVSVFHPYPGYYSLTGNTFVQENNDSLVLKLSGKHVSLLFPGDVDEESQGDLLHLGSRLSSDVMKVPHHGGKTSAYKPFFDAVNPSTAVVSAGAGNRFGHPHEETLQALGRAKVLRTDHEGAIKVVERNGGYGIMTFRDFQFERANGIASEVRNIKRLFSAW